MKIAILVSAFPPVHIGGAEIAAKQIAKSLAKKGHSVSVITSSDKGFPRQQATDGFLVYRAFLPNIKYLGTLVFWISSAWLIKKINPEIVYVEMIGMGMPCVLAKNLCKIPYVVQCQGSDVYLPWKGKKIISNIVLRSAGAVVVLTQDMKDTLRATFKGNVAVIPNGIDGENFGRAIIKDMRQELAIGSGEKIIIFVGGLKPIKGVRYLIEAFAMVAQKMPNARLLLVGDGPERQNLEAMVIKEGLKEKVHFVGKIENDAIVTYMMTGDIFVLPSLSEGFGIVNLESMACGLPIIATNVGGIPEIVTDGENGFLVSPKNPAQIAEKILLLFTDDKLREKISKNNKEKVKEYDWQNIVAKLEKVYGEVLENSK